ncbi:hypothetical protein [Sorangium sp. So ce381]|uniref:hypothetical protein n=1 Tax=Sorangium sp. So ce381 TaxID=3133307 RepID=UPI003F5B2DCF
MASVNDRLIPRHRRGAAAASSAGPRRSWLHANCSHCHNRSRPKSDGARCYDPERRFDFTLRVGELASVESTATYRTAIGPVIDPGDPDGSDVVERARRRDPDWPSMPPLGTEIVDEAGLDVLRTWIRNL